MDKLNVDEMFEMFFDRQGCLQLQKVLKKGDKVFYFKCLAAISQDFARIAKDRNGNYVLAAVVLEAARTGVGIPWLIRKTATNLETLVKHPFGCRVFQRLYESSIPDLMNPISKKLMHIFDDLVHSKYGKHIVQCLAQLQPYKQIVEALLAKKLKSYLCKRNACLVVESALVGRSSWFHEELSKACENLPLSVRSAKHVRRKIVGL